MRTPKHVAKTTIFALAVAVMLLSPSIAQAVESTPLLDELRSAYSQAIADVATAQSDVEAAEAARDTAQQAYDNVAEIAAARAAEGSFGFFEYVGATDALTALNDSTYASFTVRGDENDATSLENMRASLQWMRVCNTIRSSLGLGELVVTDELMAMAQSNANYSDTQLGHAKQFNVGENLAWNYGSDPFIQWYDNEKVYFDNAWASITGGRPSDAPVGAAARDWYSSNKTEVDAYIAEAYPGKSVGHYMNVIRSSYTTTGFAICSRGTMNGWLTYSQVFSFGSGMSVDDYEARFLNYYDSVCGDSIGQIEAEALAEAQAAVEEAQGMLESCINSRDAALAALDDATDLSHATIEGIDPVKYYDGTPQTQDNLVVKMTVSSGTESETYTLVPGDDYTVSYSKNNGYGTATLTITGTGQKGSGEFWGQTSATFEIVPPEDPSGFQYAIEDDHVMITGYTGTDSDIVIPSEIAGKPVTIIGGGAFDRSKTITSVVIPDSVTEIGSGAFNNCTNLVSVEIPNSVKVISFQVFEGCKSLESVTMPESMDYIATQAFRGCSSLKSIDIPDGLTQIDAGVFSGCSSLTSVVIPDSVTIIRYGAFGGCSSLTSITIPDSVTTIYEHAFHGCSSLTSVDIPDSVTTIDEYAFYYCTSLTSLTIPDSVEQVGNGAFFNLAENSVIFVPSQEMKELVSGKYSTSLTTVVVTSGWQKIGSAWYYFDGDGKMVTDDWVEDSTGWCYLDADGKMATGTKWIQVGDDWYHLTKGYRDQNKWVKDTKGWCYLGEDGLMVKGAWKKDSKGWCYVGSDGYMVTNAFVPDSKGDCYVGADGYMVVATKWVKVDGVWYHITKGYMDKSHWYKDSKGWCYVGADGKMVTNGFAPDSKGMCYIGSDGYMLASTKWVKIDGVWYHITKGYMDSSKWFKDSKGWCYVGADGKMVTNGFAPDSHGNCWIGPEGYMLEETMLVEFEGDTYGILDGYMVINGSITVDGQTYSFGEDGKLITEAEPMC